MFLINSLASLLDDATELETNKSREISFYIDGYFISNLRFTTDKTYEESELECLKKLIEIVKK